MQLLSVFFIKRDIEVESKCEGGHSVTITYSTAQQITCDLEHISSVDCISRALSLVKNSCACSLADQKKILTNYLSVKASLGAKFFVVVISFNVNMNEN